MVKIILRCFISLKGQKLEHKVSTQRKQHTSIHLLQKLVVIQGLEGRIAFSILPVQVKSIKGDKTIKTYAFLDPGSTATFCSEHLMQRLNINGRRTNFLLRTMGQEKVVSTHAVTALLGRPLVTSYHV